MPRGLDHINTKRNFAHIFLAHGDPDFGLRSGQSSVTRGRIAAAHHPFSRIRQVATIYPSPALLTDGSLSKRVCLDRFIRFCRVIDVLNSIR